ncbi:BQ2448_164 [Microbotryum intermedium]|uniref:BQ2448_164 protein n=1 Tax=Microbotryum intermedium TaxID=269621 RepID=A0A238F7P1_9BASI|nr:BQ2448_164 [Microbotryum intermedium]
MTATFTVETIQRPRSSPPGARRRDVLLPPPQVNAPSPTSEPSSPTVTSPRSGGRRRARSSPTPRDIEQWLSPSRSTAETDESISASGSHWSNSEDSFSFRINPTAAPFHPIPAPGITTAHAHYLVHDHPLKQDYYSSDQYYGGYDQLHPHPLVTSPRVLPYHSPPNGSMASQHHHPVPATASDQPRVAVSNADDSSLSSLSDTMIILHGAPQQAYPSPQSSPGISTQGIPGSPHLPRQVEARAAILGAPPPPFSKSTPQSVCNAYMYQPSPTYQRNPGPMEFIPRPYPSISPTRYPPFQPPMAGGFGIGPPIYPGPPSARGPTPRSVMPRLEGGEVFYERSGKVKFWNMKGWGYLVDDHAYELDGRDGELLDQTFKSVLIECSTDSCFDNTHVEVFVHHTAIRQTGGFFRFLVPHEKVTYDLLYKEKKPHRPLGDGSEDEHEPATRHDGDHRHTCRQGTRQGSVIFHPAEAWSKRENCEPEMGLAAQNVRDGIGMGFWHFQREALFEELGLASRLPKKLNKDTKTTTTTTAHSPHGAVGGGPEAPRRAWRHT